MKILVEAINTPPIWRMGGTAAKLRVYAQSDFQTSNGQWVSAGHPGQLETFCLEIICTILGNVITIPSFEIDSTVDALVNPSALYTAQFISSANRRFPFLSNFPVNTLEAGDPSMTWGEILQHRNGYAPQSLSTSILRQIEATIQLAVGNLNKASDTNFGGTAVTVAPLDPVFPIAVGANDPLWLALQSGTGLLTESGTAVMVNGAVTVPSTIVLAGSIIGPFSMDAGVSHALHVPSANIVPGVSFDIVSSDGGDNGVVAWVLTN